MLDQSEGCRILFLSFNLPPFGTGSTLPASFSLPVKAVSFDRLGLIGVNSLPPLLPLCSFSPPTLSFSVSDFQHCAISRSRLLPLSWLHTFYLLFLPPPTSFSAFSLLLLLCCLTYSSSWTIYCFLHCPPSQCFLILFSHIYTFSSQFFSPSLPPFFVLSLKKLPLLLFPSFSFPASLPILSRILFFLCYLLLLPCSSSFSPFYSALSLCIFGLLLTPHFVGPLQLDKFWLLLAVY